MARTDRREQIIQTAMELFSERGYHATSMRDLAEALGIQAGSLYSHISSKEDVLYEVMNQGAEQFLNAAGPIAAAPGTATEKLRRLLASHLRVVADHLAAATVFLHEWRRLDPERRRLIQAKRDRYEGMMRQVIAQGVAAGEFRPVDPKFAGLLLLSVGNWSYQWYSTGGPLTPEEVADRFCDLIVGGLQAGTSQ